MLRSLLLAAALALAASPAAAQDRYAPAAFVNDEIITNYDVEQRQRLLAMTGAPRAADLRRAALDSLVDEALKRSAGQSAGIVITEEQVDAGLDQFARRNNLTPERLASLLNQNRVARSALRDFIRTELIWRGLINRRFGSRGTPTEAEIAAAVASSRFVEKTTYNLGEISLPYGNSKDAVTRQAEDISRRINGGADARALAREHSRAATRAKGGEVGWVPEDRVPPRIASALRLTPTGGATAPIEVPGGVVILTVFDKRVETVTQEGESREEVSERLRNESLGQAAAEYMQELRARAYIETR